MNAHQIPRPRSNNMNSGENVELSLQVLKQFRLIYGSAKRQFSHIESSCGVSGSQLWLLHEIAQTPGIGISELGERLSIHQSTCSQLVDKLRTKKLVVKIREEEDQRRVGLKVTAAGSKVLSKAPGPAEGVLPEALQELSDAELKKIHTGLGKIIKKLQHLDESAADKPLADI
jgi:MarR family transcriptional regulator, organic hydroperoxide resistance regulator